MKFINKKSGIMLVIISLIFSLGTNAQDLNHL
jgi:hypothetical protein